MTVNREQCQTFETPVAEVSEAIRSVLRSGQAKYSYRCITESDDRTNFDVTIVPWCWPWLLSTRLVIAVRAAGPDTQVLVKTQSQWFITGDVFEFYTGYIDDAFAALHSTLEHRT